MTNRDVAMAFGQQRRGKSGNMSTDGSTLWSYGTAVGVHMLGFTVLSRDRFSNTTAQHLSLAGQATRGRIVVSDGFRYGSSAAPRADQVVASLLHQAVEQHDKAQRARKYRDAYQATAKQLLQDAVDFAGAHGVEDYLPADPRMAAKLAIIRMQ